MKTPRKNNYRQNASETGQFGSHSGRRSQSSSRLHSGIPVLEVSFTKSSSLYIITCPLVHQLLRLTFSRIVAGFYVLSHHICARSYIDCRSFLFWEWLIIGVADKRESPTSDSPNYRLCWPWPVSKARCLRWMANITDSSIQPRCKSILFGCFNGEQ